MGCRSRRVRNSQQSANSSAGSETVAFICRERRAHHQAGRPRRVRRQRPLPDHVESAVKTASSCKSPGGGAGNIFGQRPILVWWLRTCRRRSTLRWSGWSKIRDGGIWNVIAAIVVPGGASGAFGRTVRHQTARLGAAPYSVTSPGRRPAARAAWRDRAPLAVFRLITRSKFIGCSTGRSPALANLEDLVGVLSEMAKRLQALPDGS